jgi:hypothetical protein
MIVVARGSRVTRPAPSGSFTTHLFWDKPRVEEAQSTASRGGIVGQRGGTELVDHGLHGVVHHDVPRGLRPSKGAA